MLCYKGWAKSAMLVERWDKFWFVLAQGASSHVEKMKITIQSVKTGPCPTVYILGQQTWNWTWWCHLSWSCWTTSPVRVMVCRSEYSGCCCCWLLPLWASTWVSGWTMDMWTFRLWAFSKRFPHIRHANSKSASALCLVMWYFREALCRHWKPHTSHLKSEKPNSIYRVCLLSLLLMFKLRNKPGILNDLPKLWCVHALDKIWSRKINHWYLL